MFLEVKLFYKRKIISFAESEKKYDFVGGLGGGGGGGSLVDNFSVTTSPLFRNHLKNLMINRVINFF